MKRFLVVLFCFGFFTAGCTHKVAVVTLESAIEQAAAAAQRAAGRASDKIKIEVSVANGYKASADVPISVVELGAGTSFEQTTKLTIEVDLQKFVPPEKREGTKKFEPTKYILDLNTGLLE